ncbi:MAG: sigma-70 family RNA polymerase sigma factor [Solirubrobacterales bacterium]
MSNQDLLAEHFEEHRTYLHSVAVRMLGSAGEADDAVQEAWLRLSRSDSDAVDNLRAWLTTVVGRISLDMLRSRKSRREESEGDHLEPIVSELTEENPAEEAELSDSVGLAMLVVLETLTPAERIAFVLHDMFSVPFSEISEITGRSADAARKLASRARRRVRGAGPPPETDFDEQRRVIDAFLAAARAGDFEALLEVLDPDVVFRMHTVEGDPRALPPAVGAEAIAKQTLRGARTYAPHARPALVNGRPGVVTEIDGRRISVMECTVRDGRLASIDLIVDPLPERP